MYLYQKGLFREFSVSYFCCPSKACTWYALVCWDCSSISLLFVGFRLRLLTRKQHICYRMLLLFNTLLLIRSKFTASEHHVFSLHHDFLISKDLCFSCICFLWYYLCSQMISAIRTVIRLVCFSLQAALSKYENRAVWIPENECSFFHLVLYITWGLENRKINIDLLLSVPCPCNTVNLDTVNLYYSTFLPGF